MMGFKCSTCRRLLIWIVVTLAVSAHADSSPDTGLQDMASHIEVEFIAPSVVSAGDHFTVYAWVQNNSDEMLVYPSIARPQQANQQIEAGYSYRQCGLDCVRQTGIAPGTGAYLGAGIYYYSGEHFADGTMLIDDYTLNWVRSGQAAIHETPLATTLSVDVVFDGEPGTPNPAVAVPHRQSLLLADLTETGDELIVHDPNTGNDWLRHDATRPLSIDEIRAATEPGGAFAGFTMARISQVEELMMNHLHAAGLSAQIFDLYNSPPSAVRQEMADLIHIMQPAFENWIMGAVANGPPYYDMEEEVLGRLTIAVDPSPDALCGCPGGMARAALSISAWDSPQNISSVWLVRPAEAAPERPDDTASFYDHELILPEVRIDETHYRVTLTLIDPRLGLLRLSGLEPVPATSDALVFDGNSGQIDIPEARLIEADGSEQDFRLVLDLVEHLDPPMLQVIEMQALGSPGHQ